MSDAFAILINPTSGAKQPDSERIQAAIAQANAAAPPIEFSESASNFTRKLNEFAEQGIRHVALWGGDGTLNLAIPALIEHSLTFSILPGGSANVLARQLGNSLCPYQALERLLTRNFETRPLDVYQSNLGHFIVRAEIGIHADIIESATSELKDRWGWLAYWLEGMRHYASPTPFAATITTPDREIFIDDLVTCFITNTPAINLLGQASEDTNQHADGNLHLIPLRLRHLNSAPNLAQTLLEACFSIQQMDIHSHTSATITTQAPQKVVLDGELVGHSPLKLEVLPKSLTIALV